LFNPLFSKTFLTFLKPYCNYVKPFNILQSICSKILWWSCIPAISSSNKDFLLFLPQISAIFSISSRELSKWSLVKGKLTLRIFRVDSKNYFCRTFGNNNSIVFPFFLDMNIFLKTRLWVYIILISLILIYSSTLCLTVVSETELFKKLIFTYLLKNFPFMTLMTLHVLRATAFPNYEISLSSMIFLLWNHAVSFSSFNRLVISSVCWIYEPW